MAMKLEYVKTARYQKDTSCPHNGALVCDVKNCKRCGWNPNVAKIRMEKFQAKSTGGR